MSIDHIPIVKGRRGKGLRSRKAKELKRNGKLFNKASASRRNFLARSGKDIQNGFRL